MNRYAPYGIASMAMEVMYVISILCELHALRMKLSAPWHRWILMKSIIGSAIQRGCASTSSEARNLHLNLRGRAALRKTVFVAD